MPKVSFKNRLVFDKNFFDDFKKGKLKCKSPSVLIKLMYINDKSSDHKRMHNVMSKELFEKILKENKLMSRAILKSSFYDLNDPEIENIKDEIERTIKIAIDLLDEKPNRSLILTSSDKKEKYEKNPHFKGIKEIDVKSGREALVIINDYFESCTYK